MKKLILLLIAYILSLILFPAGLLYSFFANEFKPRKIAVAIDQMGNVVLAGLLDKLLITKKSKFPFGDEDMTISQVLGYNYLNSTLTRAGNFIVYLLDLIEINHCLKSIK